VSTQREVLAAPRAHCRPVLRRMFFGRQWRIEKCALGFANGAADGAVT
jgi:hypothetical protein